MSEDLDPKWNEPALRNDVRLLGKRLDNKYELLLVELKLMISHGLLMFIYVTIMINLAVLWIFALLIR